MLQTPKTAEIIQHPASSTAPAHHDLLTGVIALVRRQYPTVLIAFILTMAVAGIYLLTAPVNYTATATLLIDTRKNQLFQQQSVLGDIPVDTASVESQVQILRSETIAQAVIRDLRLTEDPEFTGSGGLIRSVVEAIGDLFQASTGKPQFEILRRTTEAFSDRLAVRRVGLTYIIEISFRSLSPDRAAQIANAVADAYITDLLDAKYKATRRASTWLQERIRELREQASAAERAVVEFKTRNNIIESGGRLMNEQELAELNSQLVLSRSQVSEARARLDRIQAVLDSESPDATVNATVADTFNNQVVTKLRSQYLELANREADWSARYGRTHLAAVNLRNQMREIRASILDELRRLSESYKSDYEIAKQREDAVQKQLAQSIVQSQTTNQAQVALRELESSAQTYRALYDNFLQRYMESVQQQSFPITEARLITEASRPLKSSSPRVLVVIAVAGLGGLIVGGWAASFRDRSDRVLRTSKQVEALLQTDCISILPRIKKAEKPDAAPAAVPAGSRVIARDQSLFWHVIDEPFSRFTESIRAVKVAADLQSSAKLNKVIGFTSALPNEGKSTVAAALAHLVSQVGANAILVDADLRNPSLSRQLARGCKFGLQDVISGHSALEEVLWIDPVTKLSLLPSATRARVAHTSEILASEPARLLFERLRATYDYVIVDLSPLAPVVDVRTTTGFVDTYFFVVEWGKTDVDVIEHALSDATGVYERLAGVVLNKADIHTLSRYGNYGYYKNKYYGRYGYTD